MKRIAVFLSVVLLFFSCTDQFYTEFQDGSDSKLNDIIFPEPQPFQPEPIVVSGFQASNGDFLDEIEIKWNPVRRQMDFTKRKRRSEFKIRVSYLLLLRLIHTLLPLTAMEAKFNCLPI